MLQPPRQGSQQQFRWHLLCWLAWHLPVQGCPLLLGSCALFQGTCAPSENCKGIRESAELFLRRHGAGQASEQESMTPRLEQKAGKLNSNLCGFMGVQVPGTICLDYVKLI